MKKMWLRIFSAFLAVMMVFTILPMSVFAADRSGAQNPAAGNENAHAGDDGDSSIGTPVYNLTYENWDGKVATGFARGAGTGENPYIIATGAQLMYFAAQVNGGKTYAGEYIRLANNIHMDMLGVHSGKTWTPIGYSANHPFEGNFDGGDHEITGLNITYDSGIEADSEQFYVGFFGYVNNATVCNFGIYDYRIDQTYTYDTTIGGLVAYAAGSTTITDCYANGEIGAAFENISPLGRDDVVKYTTIPDELNYVNPNGQGVIVHIRDDVMPLAAQPSITLVIKGDVSAVRLVNVSSAVFGKINIVIEDHDIFPLYLELVNVNITGDSANGTIYCKGDRPVYINSTGTSNSISGASGAPAIKASAAAVTILGTANLTLKGGAGVNGTDGENGTDNSTATNGANGKDGTAGTGGTNGAVAIHCKTLNLHHSGGTFYATGGNGGNGGNGGKGGGGARGTAAVGAWDTGKDGGKGGNGGNGGAGGKGGNGAYAVQADAITIYSGSDYYLTSGKGGNGGNGGKGGKGGNGADGAGADGAFWGGNYIWDSGRILGVNGGAAGKGGNGGNGGNTGMSPATAIPKATTIDTYDLSAVTLTTQGVPTAGTAGGTSGHGTPGRAGKSNYTNWIWATKTKNGSAGAVCTSALSGGNPGTVTKDANTTPTNIRALASNENLSTVLLYYVCNATLVVGGLVGGVDSTVIIERCAAVVNDVQGGNNISPASEHNKVVAGNLMGQGTCQSADTIAAYYGEDGCLAAYEPKPTAIAVLNPAYQDAQGVTYDNGIMADNTVSHARSVHLAPAKGGDILIPDYVFSGRLVSAVTEIRGRQGDNVVGAFEGSAVTKVTVGNNVVTIGDYAFKDCEKLTEIDLGVCTEKVGAQILSGCDDVVTIKIGAQLTTIPELGNAQTPFGIDKSRSDLEQYVVHTDNPALCAVDGILYEQFPMPNSDITIPVAVIDAPAETAVKDYNPQNLGESQIGQVVKLYPGAFMYTSIETVRLDYIREVGAQAFFGATRLRTVTFGNPVENENFTILDEVIQAGQEHYSQVIGKSAFQGCTGLQTVNLDSDFIHKIGVEAFAGSGSSAKPLKITLGKNISTIGADDDEILNGKVKSYQENQNKDFANCFVGAYVQSFAVAEGNAHFYADESGVLYLKETNPANQRKELFLIVYPKSQNKVKKYDVPTSIDGRVVTRISMHAFYGADYLEHLTIGDGVEVVDDGAFYGAKTFSITFGKNVRIIGNTSEGMDKMFEGCFNLVNLYVDEENAAYSDRDGVLFNKEQTTLIKYPQAKAGDEWTAPATLQKISRVAFSGNGNIRRAVFVSEITEVGDSAFYNCPNLIFIYFSVGDAPANFTSQDIVSKSGAFDTRAAQAMVCYGEETARWLAITRTEKNPYTNSEGNFAFTLEKFNGYPIDRMPTGYYAVAVNDSAGNPLNNMYVELRSDAFDETIKTQGGYAMFYNLDYDTAYRLRVVDNHGVYFPVENAQFYLDEFTRITYVTLNSVPTLTGVNVYFQAVEKEMSIGTGEETLKVQSTLKAKTQDINSETVKINKALTSLLDITVSCGLDAGSTIKRLELMSGDKIVSVLETVDDGDKQTRRNITATFALSKEGVSRLSDEAEVYARTVVQDAKGAEQIVKEKLQLHVFTFEPVEMELPLMNLNVEVAFPEPLKQLLGIPSLPLGGEDRQINVVTILDADTYRVAVEFNRDNLKKWGFDRTEGKDSVDLFNEWVENEKLLSATENVHKGTLGYSLSGFIEQKYKGLDELGRADIEVSSGITGTLEYQFNTGTTITVVFIPVRLEVEITVTGELELKLVFDNEGLKKILPSDGDLSLEIVAKVEFRAGIGCVFASVGVYGNMKLTILAEILPSPALEEVVLNADVGLYVKYDGLFIKWKESVSLLDLFKIPHEWVLYSKEETADVWSLNSTRTYSYRRAVVDEDNYEIALSSFDPETMTFTLKGVEEMQDNAYGAYAPKMVQAGDLIYIVYPQDVNGYSDLYDAYNYQKLVYQIYNTKEDTFSDVYVVEDNGFADGAFEVYTDGTTVGVVYTQMKSRLTSANVEDLTEFVGAMEVKTAVLNRDAAVQTLTANDAYEMNLRVGVMHGKLTAVWVENPANTLFGTTENNDQSIWYSVLEDGVWSDAKLLKGNLGTVTDVEIGADGVVYITDLNNDLATVDAERLEEGTSDRAITVLDMQGNAAFVTAQADAYYDVSYVGDAITYYVDGMLYTIDINADTVSACFDAAVAQLTDDYTVLTDAEGNVIALLFVGQTTYDAETEADGSNLYALFCNEGQWGQPIQLTDYGAGQYVQAYDAVDGGDKMWLSVLLSSTDAEGIETNRIETDWMAYPTDVVMGEIGVDLSTVAPGAPVMLTLLVTNMRYQAVTAIPVTITRDGKTVHSGTYTTFYDEDGKELNGALLSGESAYVHVSFTMDGVDGSPDYAVGMFGKSRPLRLWYSDFEVFGKQVKIGDRYYIVARVTNVGYVPASRTVSLRMRDEVDGQTVDVWTDEAVLTTNLLGYGETQYLTFDLSNAPPSNGSQLLYVCVSDDGERMTANNETKINVAINALSSYVGLSQTSMVLDRDHPQTMGITFEAFYTWQSATINGKDATALFAVDGNTITPQAQAILDTYGNGYYVVEFRFNYVDENGETQYRDADFALTINQRFTVSWVVDDVAVKTEELDYDTIPVAEEVEKAADAQYVYRFIGWDANDDGVADEIGAVHADTTYVAVFEYILNAYGVTWVVDGVSTEQTYDYGETPVYPDLPTKPSDAKYDYAFVGWDREVAMVTGHATYTAVFASSLRKYTITTVVEGVSSTMQVEYGAVPTPEMPQKASDEQYDYTFTGWSPALTPVYEDKTYTATFQRSLRQYTIVFVVDGQEIPMAFDYGTMPQYDGTPVKASDAQYSYSFSGWDKAFETVDGDAVYTALFEATVNEYTVQFVINDETVYTREYLYGEVPSYEGVPAKPLDETYRYRFIGWDKEMVAVTGDVVYVAQYEAILRGSATVTNTTSAVVRGDTFTTTVTLSDVTDMQATTITVYYNPAVVTLQEYYCHLGATVVAQDEGYIVLRVESLVAYAHNAVIDLTFAVGEDMDCGTYEFIGVVGEDDHITAQLEQLSVYRVGDVDGNDVANNRDLALLQRHLNGWDVTITVAADMDGDGVVNNRDVGLLQQLLNA